MNLLTTVLIVFVVLVILYYIINWLTTKSVKLITMQSASKQTRVPTKKLKNSNTSNFTYSIWFFVEEWEIGKQKQLLNVKNKQGDDALSINLGQSQNDINIKVLCRQSGGGGGGSGVGCQKCIDDGHEYCSTNQSCGVAGTCDQAKSICKYPVGACNLATCPAAPASHAPMECNVKNFPLQKWVNLIVSVYGRTLDVYLDGKLTKTCVLPNVANMHALEEILVGGGFTGHIADLRQWSDASNPQQAYNIYASGFGSGATNIFNKYKIRVAFLEDGKSEGHFDI